MRWCDWCFPQLQSCISFGGFSSQPRLTTPKGISVNIPLLSHYYPIINFKSYFSWYFNITEFHMFPLLLMFPLCHWGIVYLGTPITAEAWVTATAAQFINQLTTYLITRGGQLVAGGHNIVKTLVSWRLYYIYIYVYQTHLGWFFPFTHIIWTGLYGWSGL